MELQPVPNLQQSAFEFVQTAVNTVGTEPTIQLLDTLKKLIIEQPKIARKLADKETQEKLTELAEQNKGKKFDLLMLPRIIKSLQKIFA